MTLSLQRACPTGILRLQGRNWGEMPRRFLYFWQRGFFPPIDPHLFSIYIYLQNPMADRTLWLHPDNDRIVQIVDQRYLPHQYVIADLATVEDAAVAIRDMWVRGAPLIGAVAAYGVALAMRTDASDAALALADGACRPAGGAC